LPPLARVPATEEDTFDFVFDITAEAVGADFLFFGLSFASLRFRMVLMMASFSSALVHPSLSLLS
jgi:hypothetical protein